MICRSFFWLVAGLTMTEKVCSTRMPNEVDFSSSGSGSVSFISNLRQCKYARLDSLGRYFHISVWCLRKRDGIYSITSSICCAFSDIVSLCISWQNPNEALKIPLAKDIRKAKQAIKMAEAPCPMMRRRRRLAATAAIVLEALQLQHATFVFFLSIGRQLSNMLLILCYYSLLPYCWVTV